MAHKGVRLPLTRLVLIVRMVPLLAIIIASSVTAVSRPLPVRLVATTASSSSLPVYDHVFLIVMENHNESGSGGIIGNPDAPYINALAGEYGLATNYFGVGHPSLPNYLALGGGSTFGVTADCDPTALCGSVQFPLSTTTPNIGDLIEGAGKSWKAYEESMATTTSGCFGVSGNGSTPNTYVPRHNPFVYFADVQTNIARCRAHIAPYSALGSRSGGDLASDATTPAFAFITPNLCHDMHDDCSSSLGTNPVQTGDAWLKQEVPKIFGSDAFAKHNSLLVINWDESGSGSANHVAAMFVAPTATPQFSSNATYTHYSLLRSIEQAMGVGTLTANDAGATSMGEFIGTAAAPSGLNFPIRASFYYPWFPETMTGTPNPFSYYSPSLGQYYDSSDPVVLSNHIRSMQYGGINLGIASWWGPNGQNSSKTDYRFPLLLREAKLRNFNWAIYYEKGQLTTDPAAIAADLAYIKANYTSDPNYLKIGGRPVIFVYNTLQPANPCDITNVWNTANRDASVGNGSAYFYVVMKVFSGYAGCSPQPDDWHQYNPDSRSSAGSPYWFTVSPGFWLATEANPRLERDVNDINSGNGAYFAAVRSMVSTTSYHWHLITTFNEWGEGHSVESASPPNLAVNSHCTASTTTLAHPCSWNTASGYGAYLDILHNNPDSSTTTTLASIQVAPATATIIAGASQAFTATGFDGSANSLGDVTSSTTFSISPNGTCSGNACTATVAGTHTVTASDAGHTATATLTVGAAGLDHLGLAPVSASIVAGGSQSYTATGLDQYGNSLGDVTAATVFSIAPNGSCSGAGCTATVAGSHTVTGTDAGKTGTATLTVTAAALDHLALSPASASIGAGSSQVYTATGLDQYGNSLGNVTAATTFSIGPDGSCTAASCTATLPGPHTVTGTDGGKMGSASLVVSPAGLAVITIAPSTASIVAGSSQSYTASGFDNFGNSLGDVTSSTTFSIAPNGSCTNASCNANLVGSHTVTGTNSGHTASATLTVTAGLLDHLGLTPATASIIAGATQSYSATGFDPYGNSLGDLTSLAGFGISPNGSCAGADCTATVTGVHAVTATVAGKTGTASLTVNPAAFDHLVLSPGSASIAAGAGQSYSATGFDQYGNGLGDITSSTTFSIAPSGSCTGSTCTATVATAYVVTGNHAGKTATANLTVTAGAVAVLIIAPASASIGAGSSQVYTATGLDQYGNSLGNVTASTTFSIGPDGSCTAGACGTTVAGVHMVTGNNGTAAGTATLTVVAGTAVAIRLSPDLATVAAGTPQAYTVSEVDVYGNLGSDVSSTSVFRVAPEGTCTANACSASLPGVHVVTASRFGKTATATLTVSAGPVDTLTISPASATIDAGGSQAYTTTGTDAYGNLLGDLTGVTVFSVAPEGACSAARCVARVSGSHLVTASSGGRTATAVLLVTLLTPPPPVPVSPSATPAITATTPSPSAGTESGPPAGGENVLPTPSASPAPDPASSEPATSTDAGAGAASWWTPGVAIVVGALLLLALVVAYAISLILNRRL